MATAIFEIGNVQIDKLTEPSGGGASTFGDTITAPGIDAPASSVFNIAATNATALNLGHTGLSTYAYGSNFFIGSNFDVITAGTLNIGTVNATSIHLGSLFTSLDGYLVSAGDGYFAGKLFTSTIDTSSANSLHLGTTNATSVIIGQIGASGNIALNSTYGVLYGPAQTGEIAVGDTSIYIQGATNLNITTTNSIFSCPIVPSVTNTYSLGTSGARWQDGYFGGTLTVNQVNLKTHANYTGSESKQLTAAAQSTSTTLVTAYTLTLQDNTTYIIEATAVGRDEAGANHAVLGRVACMYRESAGAATQEGTTSTLWADIHTAPQLDLQFSTSGNNVLIQVKGPSSTTVDWVVTIKYQAVSTTA